MDHKKKNRTKDLQCLFGELIEEIAKDSTILNQQWKKITMEASEFEKESTIFNTVSAKLDSIEGKYEKPKKGIKAKKSKSRKLRKNNW